MDAHNRSTSIQNIPAKGAGYALIVLLLTALVSFLDRQILALLVGPVRHDLAISDTQIGLLQGLAFSIFYGLAALPAGVVADRWSRRNLIVVALCLWSAATISCAFARSFQELFICRLVVGLGEACLGPAALSLIADLYPEESRGRAIGIYQMGLYVGVGGSLVLGGFVLFLLKDKSEMSAPLVGVVSSWRAVFAAVGVAGLVLIPFLVAIREPARPPAHGAGLKRAGVMTDLTAFRRYLARNWRIVLAVDLFYALIAFFGNGVGAWIPSLYIRSFEFRPSEAGLVIGLITTLAGVLACVASGALGDRWVRRRVPGDRYRTSLVGCGLAIASLVIFPLTGVLPVSLLFVGVAMFANAFLVTAGPSVISDLSPGPFRAKAMSLYFFGAALIGSGLGPPTIGLINDAAFHSRGLGWAIALGPLAVLVIAVGICWATLPAFERARSLKDAEYEQARVGGPA